MRARPAPPTLATEDIVMRRGSVNRLWSGNRGQGNGCFDRGKQVAAGRQH